MVYFGELFSPPSAFTVTKKALFAWTAYLTCCISCSQPRDNATTSTGFLGCFCACVRTLEQRDCPVVELIIVGRPATATAVAPAASAPREAASTHTEFE